MKKIILILYLCPVLMLGQTEEQPDITGVWRTIASSWTKDTKQYADCEMIKFITNDRWANLYYWPKTKEFAGAGGGTYTFVNGNYVETIEFFTWDASAIGTKQTFKKKIKDGKLVQEGHLNTEKFNYPYYAVYDRLDKLSWVYENEKSPQGVWDFTNGTLGTKKLDKKSIKDKFGRAIKTITPKYFISTHFDYQKKTFDGLTFGTYVIDKDGNYKETVLCWSWEDKSMINSQPSFEWEQLNQNNFHQRGYLNSETYKNYLVDEYYERIEPLSYQRKLWTSEDKKLLNDELERTKNEMVVATKKLTDDQWHFKSDENSWNIAQVVEHMGIYERLYYFESQVTVNNTNPRPYLARKTLGDKKYLEWMAEKKPHTSPKQAVPMGFMKGKDNLEYFLFGRNLLNNMVKSTDKDLKAHFTPRRGEPKKFRSIHGLLVIHYGHTDRHLRQIERIKAHHNYPKK